MPGFALSLVPADATNERGRKFEHAQGLMLHHSDYRAVVDFRSATCLVGHVAYPEYPTNSFQEQELWVGVEGEVYLPRGQSLRTELTGLFRALSHEPRKTRQLVRKWVNETDGDYVVIGVTEGGRRCIVFSDPYGRLPLYARRDSESLLVAREPKFLAAVTGSWAYDPLGCGEYIWFGFSLGRRTLWRGVERLPGGLLLEASVDGTRVESSVGSLFVPNTDDRDHSGRSAAAFASDLADQFTEGTKERSRRRGSIVVSLSGGHDSRSVAAALRKSGVDCVAATFQKSDGSARADLELARRIAASLGIPWEGYFLDAPSPEAAEQLTWIKDGLNYVAMSFILDFLDRLVLKWGRTATYWTGDGGRVFPDLRPTKRPTNLDEAVEAVIRLEAVTAADHVERALGLQAGSLPESLRSCLCSYEERDPVQKVVHFRVYERWRSWMFEGEDRNRFFLWELTPFYALPFLNAVMRVPDDLKKGGGLYLAFQRCLSPAITRIPHSEVGQAIASPLYRWRLAIASRTPKWAKRALRGRLRAAMGPLATAPAASKAFGEAVPLGSKVGELLSEVATVAMLETATSRAVDNWRTLVLLDRVWSARLK